MNSMNGRLESMEENVRRTRRDWIEIRTTTLRRCCTGRLPRSVKILHRRSAAADATSMLAASRRSRLPSSVVVVAVVRETGLRLGCSINAATRRSTRRSAARRADRMARACYYAGKRCRFAPVTPKPDVFSSGTCRGGRLAAAAARAAAANAARERRAPPTRGGVRAAVGAADAGGEAAQRAADPRLAALGVLQHAVGDRGNQEPEGEVTPAHVLQKRSCEWAVPGQQRRVVQSHVAVLRRSECAPRRSE